MKLYFVPIRYVILLLVVPISLFSAEFAQYGYLKFVTPSGQSIIINAKGLPTGQTRLSLDRSQNAIVPFDFSEELLPLFELATQSQLFFNLAKSDKKTITNQFGSILNSNPEFLGLNLEHTAEFLNLLDYYNFDKGLLEAAIYYLVKNKLRNQESEAQAIEVINPNLLSLLARYIYLIHNRRLQMPENEAEKTEKIDIDTLQFSIRELLQFKKINEEQNWKIKIDPLTNKKSLMINLAGKNINSLDGFDLVSASLVNRNIKVTIDLSHNKLTQLDAGFITMVQKLHKNLEKIDLSGNKLTFLPDFIKDLPALKILDLHDNSLTTLPRHFATNCMALEELNLHKNHLAELHLPPLPKLKNVDVSDNQLTLPPVLDNFAELEIVNLNNNLLEHAPLFSGCPRLREIYLDENDISSLPDGFAANSPDILYIYIIENRFTPESYERIPENIKGNVLGFNQQQTGTTAKKRKRTESTGQDGKENYSPKKPKIE